MVWCKGMLWGKNQGYRVVVCGCIGMIFSCAMGCLYSSNMTQYLGVCVKWSVLRNLSDVLWYKSIASLGVILYLLMYLRNLIEAMVGKRLELLAWCDSKCVLDTINGKHLMLPKDRALIFAIRLMWQIVQDEGIQLSYEPTRREPVHAGFFCLLAS